MLLVTQAREETQGQELQESPSSLHSPSPPQISSAGRKVPEWWMQRKAGKQCLVSEIVPQIVSSYTKLHWAILGYTTLHWATPGYTGHKEAASGQCCQAE